LQFETKNPATILPGCRLEPRADHFKIRKAEGLENRPKFLVLAGVPSRRNNPAGANLAPRKCGDAMTREEERELNLELERLKQEHRDLDSAIDALLATNGHDRIQVQRLKKRKLQLRDRVSAIEDELFPDIIA
jgi:hypothetical protein